MKRWENLLRHVVRIVLLLAGLGVLEAALGTTDVGTLPACILSTADQSTDDGPCSPSGTSDGNVRPPSGGLGPGHDTKPKSPASWIARFCDPPVDDDRPDVAAERFSNAGPVYLITRRLRI